MKAVARMSCVALVVLLLVALVGCKVKVNRGAYDACRVGMTKEEVKSIIHIKRWVETKDTLVYEGDNVIKVQFDFDDNGKMTKKEWISKKDF